MSDTEPLREDVARFLAFLAMMNGPTSRQLGPVEARKAMRANVQLSDLPVGTLAVIRDLAIPRGDGSLIPARLFDARPSSAHPRPGPAILFTHGGGWVVGDLDTHAALCAEIARQIGLPLVAIDYRLAPEHPWPAGPDDAETAARWLAASPADLGNAVTGLVLIGDSAGGTLAIVTAMALRDRPAATPVLALAAAYPPVDHARGFASFERFAAGHFLSSDGMDWFEHCYAPDLGDWRGAPIRGDQRGMPPTVVLAASHDPLVDQARAYAAAAIASGVSTIYREARGTIHGFLNMRNALPSAVDDLAGFLAALKPVILESEAALVRAAGDQP